MILLDSNLLIYSAQDKFAFLRLLISNSQTHISAMSKLETLGYQKLSTEERLYFEGIFKTSPVIPVTDDVIDKAVELRQQKKMSVGDCIIAATALLNGFDLYTNNAADFAHIPDLNVVNPLGNQ
ncbi:type II toxin-antitoxin system VapC family toxin [Fibrella sp. HMF5335]|uniref:Type II toxin-antitoxin system VapC family toxin n=1 Tax=Fibrella rubiginis TaxID=2817060 RepID=A0A939GEY7_9BACT|nr:type II toxin-antitoxin system VapC family toxin [Fibrella rubiginis]MBO0936553.1 type II toxin-antitoxin system VapC family toxin [Fibrella rubiginis]